MTDDFVSVCWIIPLLHNWRILADTTTTTTTNYYDCQPAIQQKNSRGNRTYTMNPLISETKKNMSSKPLSLRRDHCWSDPLFIWATKKKPYYFPLNPGWFIPNKYKGNSLKSSHCTDWAAATKPWHDILLHWLVHRDPYPYFMVYEIIPIYLGRIYTSPIEPSTKPGALVFSARICLFLKDCSPICSTSQAKQFGKNPFRFLAFFVEIFFGEAAGFLFLSPTRKKQRKNDIPEVQHFSK